MERGFPEIHAKDLIVHSKNVGRRVENDRGDFLAEEFAEFFEGLFSDVFILCFPDLLQKCIGFL